MDAVIKPSKAFGSISAPPSKSMAHRYIICAALAEGTSIISNLAGSEDILATLDCIKALGAEVDYKGDSAVITGIGGKEHEPNAELFCRESGSTLRFFIPIALALGTSAKFHGSETLMTRPMSVYEDICRDRNLSFERKDGCILVSGKLSGGEYEFAGNVSSQFVTGLLFALPMLEGCSTIKLIPPVESRSYIGLTLQALRDFGIKADWKDDCTLEIPGGQAYKPVNCAVEGDWSNAAFLDVFNVLGGSVEVSGVREDSLQGDRVCTKHFRSLAKGFAEIDITDCPDLGPVLMAAAAALNGGVFTGTKRLAIKESNRGLVMCEELKAFGISSDFEEDRITIYKSELKAPKEAVGGHNDHRIVMSMATLLSLTGGTVTGAQAVRKSFPDYFDRIKQLGIEVEFNGMD